ncbi:MAG: bifunctional 5,10-methylenetetrahydrofolate dehydrogenase/5,10-methenyltetrahydrofolate cyclohydrolase [Lachnospiraceae bacterium]|jgi:methylenetetrahydrofolate dehydrogenase (NADP+)/methenyltetrahydrofolate cyclohydrolase|nr:bifunctional 5,10-methylenetetrahydrofolate dehydrogenase/5,10-methenyltetrahydrofolate cyclohydrolase [Lachnospiraceae bacterium]
MEHILKGAPVAAAIKARTKEQADALAARGIFPTLAVLEVGERADNAAYLRGIQKNAGSCGIEVRHVTLPEDASQNEAEAVLQSLNADASVHGILLLRPLPKQIDEAALCGMIAPEKDADCATDLSLAGVFAGKKLGFAPCTAQAVVEILKFYGAELAGARCAVVGRSLVVGRPLAMLLLNENATVTLCHSKTKDLPAATRGADIVVAALGKAKALGGEHFGENQILIDVGIHRTEEGTLCGDVDFAAAEPKAAAITPVPGGVGAVTTAVLLSHVAQAAGKNK